MIKRIKYVLYTELGKDGDLCGESFLMRERQRIFVEAVFSFGFDQREGESQMSAGAPSFSI